MSFDRLSRTVATRPDAVVTVSPDDAAGVAGTGAIDERGVAGGLPGGVVLALL
jgi:hypothetical protein